jgi:hypothetical protein
MKLGAMEIYIISPVVSFINPAVSRAILMQNHWSTFPSVVEVEVTEFPRTEDDHITIVQLKDKEVFTVFHPFQLEFRGILWNSEEFIG